MSDELLLDLIARLPIILIRFFTGALLLLHLFFSVIIIRQTKNMIKIVEAQISPTIILISVIHFLVSVVVFIWSLLFLFIIPI